MKIRIENIRHPDKKAFLTHQAKFYSIYLGNNLKILFTGRTHAEAYEKSINQHVNDMADELKMLSVQLYSWYKTTTGFTDISEMRSVQKSINTWDDAFIQLSRPHFQYYFIWVHLGTIISSLLDATELLNKLQNRIAYRPTISRLKQLQNDLRNLGVEQAERILIHVNGKPRILTNEEYKQHHEN